MKPKIPDIGSRLSRKFSAKQASSDSKISPKKVRFRVDSAEESSDADEYLAKESFKKLSFQSHQCSTAEEAKEAVQEQLIQQLFPEQAWQLETTREENVTEQWNEIENSEKPRSVEMLFNHF